MGQAADRKRALRIAGAVLVGRADAWRAGQFRPLVVFGRKERMAQAPDAPTARELVKDPEELALAAATGCDFVLISPVAPTASHPGVAPLGWSGLAGLARSGRLPAYALGGMDADALPQAVAAGCLGVAAITAAWAHPEKMSEVNVRRLLAGLSAL